LAAKRVVLFTWAWRHDGLCGGFRAERSEASSGCSAVRNVVEHRGPVTHVAFPDPCGCLGREGRGRRARLAFLRVNRLKFLYSPFGVFPGKRRTHESVVSTLRDAGFRRWTAVLRTPRRRNVALLRTPTTPKPLRSGWENAVQLGVGTMSRRDGGAAKSRWRQDVAALANRESLRLQIGSLRYTTDQPA